MLSKNPAPNYLIIAVYFGLHAGNFSSGQMHLRFGEKSDFDVAVMNYSDLYEVLKFEKLELGIELPNEIQTKVDNFVNNVSVPNSQKINPYVDLALDINGVAGMKVTAEYIYYQTGEVFSVDGFYNQEFQPYSNPLSTANGSYTDEIYNSLGGYIPISTNYSFLNRFAPNKTGLWLCKIKITSTGINFESTVFTFNVIESNNPGYMGITDNGRYLKHKGKTFIPIGCNALWPQNTVRNDPDLWSIIPYSEQYLGNSKMIPRTYNKFRERLNTMIDNGANSFRVIMAPWSIDIEYGQLGNYTMHQFQAQELDNIIELADQRDIFLQLDMSVHFPFIFKGPLNYDTSCSWDQGNIYGPNNAYKDISGVSTPLDFFSNQTAKEYYKQKIRYILARWGYSTQLSVLELMSEINQVGSNDPLLVDGVGSQLVYLQNPQIYATWNKEMAAYFKSHHNGKVHLLTSGYASFGSIYDDSYDDPNFDVIGINKYDDGVFSFGTYILETCSERLLAKNSLQEPNNGYPLKTTYENPNIHPKPLIISETGLNGFNYNPPAYSLSPVGCDINLTEVRRQMWQMLFSGAAVSYQWDVIHYPEIWPEYQRMADFAGSVDFGDATNPYRPGASSSSNENGNDYWVYEEHAAEFMDDENEYRADCIYMVNQDKTRAIGVITNKTYNQYSSSTNTNCAFGEYTNDDYNDISNNNYVLNVYQKPYEFSAFNNPNDRSFAIDVNVENLQIGLTSKALKLTYMNNDGYTINYYNRTDISVIPSLSFDNANGTDNQIKFEKIINGNENDYIVPFVAIQNNNGNKSLNIEKNKNSEFVQFENIIYPNPFIDFVNYICLEDIDKIEIYDIFGSKLKEVRTEDKAGRVDLKLLKTGVYFVNFYNSGNLLLSKKMIKN